MGGSLTWVTSLFTGKLHPRHEAIELFMIENEVTEKEADSLTSEWRKLGVDCALEPRWIRPDGGGTGGSFLNNFRPI